MKKHTILRPILTAILAISLFFPGSLFSPVFAASSKVPADIAVTFGADAQTQKNFAWITKNAAPSSAVVEIWRDGEGVQTFAGTSEILTGHYNYYKDKKTYSAASNLFQFCASKVTARGLLPGTKYNYRCGDGTSEGWSGVSTFETAAPEGEFTFLYMTDAQCATDKHFELWKTCAEHGIAQFSNAKFIALAGDLTDRGCAEVLWDKFFQYGGNVLPQMTLVPAIGNHETDTGAHHFSKHFNFPDNSAGLPGYVYSFDYGDAHVMVLSTEKTYGQFTSKDAGIKNAANQFLDQQITWLRQEVANSQKKWNIVILHKALYSSGGYASAAETVFYRNKLAPVFDELSIDAVLQGHNHTFERGFLYQGKTAAGVTAQTASVTKTNGTLYLTANTAGPKFYDIAKKTDLSYLLRYAQPKTQMYTGVTVSGDALKFETYAVSSQGQDSLYDTFTIYK